MKLFLKQGSDDGDDVEKGLEVTAPCSDANNAVSNL
jgi:hypothetical protein